MYAHIRPYMATYVNDCAEWSKWQDDRFEQGAPFFLTKSAGDVRLRQNQKLWSALHMAAHTWPAIYTYVASHIHGRAYIWPATHMADLIFPANTKDIC